MRRTLFHLALVATVACSSDSPTEAEPTITRTDSFDLAVERGTQAEWTHRVTLPVGTTWVSADIVSCDEWRAISVHERAIMELYGLAPDEQTRVWETLRSVQELQTIREVVPPRQLTIEDAA